MQLYGPLISKDVVRHCRCCDSSQHYSRSAAKKDPMIFRLAWNEPYEKVALYLVGSLPNAKGGDQWVLTLVCIAKKMARCHSFEVSYSWSSGGGNFEWIFKKILPMTVLTDRGSHFVGEVVKSLCVMLSIDKLQTTAYHSQTK